MRLQKKFAVITGGASGIGRAIAERFAAEGAHAAIVDRDQAAASAAAVEIASAGGEVSAWACDVSDHADVARNFDEIVRQLGRIDILVNNAGIAHVGKLEDTSPEDFERILSVNVRGVYHCLHAAIKPMVEGGGGAILNLASVASKIGIPDRFAYSMSKGAVHMMTLSVARDYIGAGIRCNCLCPGRVHTPFVDNYLKQNYPGQEEEMFAKLAATQPIGRMGKPEEIAALAAFLCSDEAAFITGSAYDIDGGFTLLR
ncbi:MAG: SDR family oxidoreductase [Verrucomicrobiales bacterium]